MAWKPNTYLNTLLSLIQKGYSQGVLEIIYNYIFIKLNSALTHDWSKNLSLPLQVIP